MVYTTIKDLFTAICDAIRDKEGSTKPIAHQDIPDRIKNLKQTITLSGGTGSTGVALDRPNVLSVTPYDETVGLSWEDPDDRVEFNTVISKWDKAVITRKIGGPPTSLSDGVMVAAISNKNEYKETQYMDENLVNGTDYYYGVFAVSDKGAVSLGTIHIATPYEILPEPAVLNKVTGTKSHARLYYTLPENIINASAIYGNDKDTIQETYLGTFNIEIGTDYTEIPIDSTDKYFCIVTYSSPNRKAFSNVLFRFRNYKLKRVSLDDIETKVYDGIALRAGNNILFRDFTVGVGSPTLDYNGNKFLCYDLDDVRTEFMSINEWAADNITSFNSKYAFYGNDRQGKNLCTITEDLVETKLNMNPPSSYYSNYNYNITFNDYAVFIYQYGTKYLWFYFIDKDLIVNKIYVVFDSNYLPYANSNSEHLLYGSNNYYYYLCINNDLTVENINIQNNANFSYVYENILSKVDDYIIEPKANTNGYSPKANAYDLDLISYTIDNIQISDYENVVQTYIDLYAIYASSDYVESYDDLLVHRVEEYMHGFDSSVIPLKAFSGIGNTDRAIFIGGVKQNYASSLASSKNEYFANVSKYYVVETDENGNEILTSEPEEPPLFDI